MSRGAHKVGPGIAGDEPVYSRQETEVTSSRETFDLEDERGRVIGFRSWIFECSYTPANGYGYRETPRFIARTQATRNGEKFGALAPEIHADTLEAALAAVKKRRDDSFRRYARRFYRPDGRFEPESEHGGENGKAEAAARVAYLNGADAVRSALDEALNSGDGSYRP